MKEADILDQTQSVWSSFYDKIFVWINEFIDSLPNLILAIIVFILFIIISKYAGKLFNKILARSSTQASIRVISVKVLKAVIGLIGFFIALGILNLNTVLTSVLGAAGVVGLAVGLALQGTLNNTFSGVIISFLPKIQINDWIETNDFAGKVIDINLRSVVLQTADNNHVMIPNSKIVDSAFKNFSSDPRGRVTVSCGVGYESDLDEVQQITTNAIEAIFKQNFNEEIEFYYTGFGNSSIDYIIRFWTKVQNQKDIYTAQHQAILAIKKAYNKHDINIPFPIRTLDFGKNKFRSEVLDIRHQSKDDN